ncbi:UNVERIFIED_ORG: hypothetical protein J2W38_001510 [Variovorax paradoxus]|nr:hypothetical protein [Variovorax paradoxus]
MSKTVYSFQSGTGAFTGALDLDRGDLSPLQPTVYLIPGNCLEAPPPAPASGKWPFAVDGGWVLRDLLVEPEPQPELEITLEERRARLKAAATARRWMVETGGITWTDGAKVKTGIDDQTRIAQAIQGMEANGYADVSFKAESGWLTLTLAQMHVLLKTIAIHVRACFEAERSHHVAIDALDASTIESYDVLANWPSGCA